MADERTLARRYARALLEVVEAEKVDIDAVEADLKAVAGLWRETPELRTVIGHPAFNRERKRELLGAALAGKVTDVTIRFLGLLVEKKRFGLIEDIAQEYDELSDEAQGYVKAHVRSFMALSDAQRERLLAKLRTFTTRPNVVLEESVDPALLGGIVVRIGDEVLDGSIQGKLRKLRERLLLREEERAQQAAQNAVEALGG